MQQIEGKIQEHKTQFNEIVNSNDGSEMRQYPRCEGKTVVNHLSVGAICQDEEEGMPSIGDSNMGKQSNNDIVIFVSCSDCNFLDFTDSFC
jgi:hypothetical protein